LTIVVVMLDTPVLANLSGVALGLVIAAIGIDPVQGTPRFTFGFYQLYSGLNVVAVLVGFFCLPQPIVLAAGSIAGDQASPVGRIGASEPAVILRAMLLHRWNVLRASVIGTALGILPAVGPEST